ncbi:AbiH family protein [Phocaeicola barnesiae]|uniref:Bacteriophage abortive infection AbiH family protein n=1 Tax=Phocaeicola plebeius TaxID=310297 RepID=A0A921L4Z3_9BACT|nr:MULTISPECIES: AbiH family protein [Phocaeicola]HJF80288.1 bacteriophage abortive infection AbiH family protein [Phocaeicola plebeius]
MNIVYFLGNGFDKAQGLKTSYPEFYEYLDKQEGSALLQNLKSDIRKDTKLWADMEEAFGQFTSKIDTEEDFQNLYFELSDYLQEYLKSENEKFIPSVELKGKFYNDFLFFGKYLGELDRTRYNQFVNAFSSSIDINVITLNYTNTLEKLLSINTQVSNVNKNFNNNRILHNIIHVHGGLDDAIIIGVDNEKQIENEKFRMNDNVKDLLVKIQSNHAMKFLKHEYCENFIKNANLIILYGTSLGDTDLRWWNLIGNELNRRNNIAIIQHLYHPIEIKPTRRQLLAQIERNYQNTLMRKLGIKQEEFSERLTNRLFFTVNSNIFKN